MVEVEPFPIDPSREEIRKALISGCENEVIEKAQLFIVSQRFLQAEEMSMELGGLYLRRVFEIHQIDRNLYVAYKSLVKTMRRSQGLTWKEIESGSDTHRAWKVMLASAEFLHTGAWGD